MINKTIFEMSSVQTYSPHQHWNKCMKKTGENLCIDINGHSFINGKKRSAGGRPVHLIALAQLLFFILITLALKYEKTT